VVQQLSKDKFIVIRVLRDVVEGARLPEEFERVARIELAIALYARGILSLGQARRLTGLSKWELLEELARRGVERHYTREGLENDLAFAKA
jgi:predicted HTH domain antitoxin